MPEPMAVKSMENVQGSGTWLRCRCWQVGRCLADCPSVERIDMPRFGSWWWDRRASEWITASEGTVRDIERSEARED